MLKIGLQSENIFPGLVLGKIYSQLTLVLVLVNHWGHVNTAMYVYHVLSHDLNYSHNQSI